MSTITRRRVAGTSANSDDSTTESSHTANHKTSDHASPSLEKKIAYDPRDIDESKSTPRLTLMEEVLLLGLKDKQVKHARADSGMRNLSDIRRLDTHLLPSVSTKKTRVTFRSGMTASVTHYVGVLLWS